MTSVLLAEWTKIRTVRSTPWTLLPTMPAIPAPAYFAGRGFAASLDQRPTAFDPLFATFYSITLGQLGLVAFGVLAVGAEYSSGTIRMSLTAVPRRGKLYAAKAGILSLHLTAPDDPLQAGRDYGPWPPSSPACSPCTAATPDHPSASM